ncbi:MAG: hypothetical protein ACYDEJ_03445 [Desulfitobacteriaceae bacterium]
MDENCLKVLKFINRMSKRSPVSEDDLINKFDYLTNPTIIMIITWLFAEKLAYRKHCGSPDTYGAPSGPCVLIISIEGKKALRESKTITLDYVLKYIVVPLTIGILGSALAEVVKKLL